MNQKKVWNKLADSWNKYRSTPNKNVEEFLQKDGKELFLDVGCGTGRNFPNNLRKIYAIDFSRSMIKIAKLNAKRKGLDIEGKVMKKEKIPYKENTFNTIICIDVLHCVNSTKQREKILHEIYRVMKPGSKAMISTWSRNQKRIKNKPKESFIPWTVNGKKYPRYTYIYEPEELKTILKNIGFKILKTQKKESLIFQVKK